MKNKLLCAENMICVGFIPVLVFIYMRLCTFLNDINRAVPSIAVIIFSALIFAAFVIFRKRICAFIKQSAFGFTSQSLIIYVLATLVAFKYRNYFIFGDSPAVLSVIGCGLLFGFCTLLAVQGLINIVRTLKGFKVSKSDIIFLILVTVILNLSLFVYCKYMKQIFVWDNAGYFLSANKLNDIFPSTEYFKTVFESVTSTDYNYVILFFASVFRKLFGNSRYVFLLSILNCYLVPFIIILHLSGKMLLKTKAVHTLITILCVPFLVFATFVGFIDVGGMIFTLSAIILFLYSDKTETAFLVGILCAVSVILRRWYSFFALSFIITCFIYELSQKKCKRSFMTLLGFGFTLLFFFQTFVSGKLMADYKNMYSAYSLGIKTDYFIFVRYFGIIFAGILTVYSVCSQIKKRLPISKQMFILFQAVICFAIFALVQTHGQQHLCLYAPQFCLLTMMLLSEFVITKKTVIIALIFGLIQTANTLVPRVSPSSVSEIKSHALLPNFQMYPKIESYTDDILEMNKYLDREIGAKGKTACLLSSSLELNFETIMNAEISLSKKQETDIDRSSYFLQLSDVDKRDGFNENLFIADFVLVPTPMQIHLSEDEQRVITIPYKHIKDGTGFGSAYKKTDKSFDLSDGIHIDIYERTRAVTDEEKKQLINEL